MKDDMYRNEWAVFPTATENGNWYQKALSIAGGSVAFASAAALAAGLMWYGLAGKDYTPSTNEKPVPVEKGQLESTLE